MKVVLLLLGGNAEPAIRRLSARYPDAQIEMLSRSEFESNGAVSRLMRLRSTRPNVFAVATERLCWQRGQNLFMLFGALAGAGEVLIIDAHDNVRIESRAGSLIKSTSRLVLESIKTARTLAASKSELARLEAAFASDSHGTRRQRVEPRNGANEGAATDIVYLRATPGAGTQVGGASSHINGVVNAMIELGARIRFISNDLIAGLDESKTPLTVIEPEPLGTTRAAFDIHNNRVFTCAAVPLVEQINPDFIYQRYARFGWAGVAASLKTQRPLFLEYNGSEVWVGRNWDKVGMLDLLERYERLNLKAAARIFVVSEVEKRNLERAGVVPEKIVVNPNGVDAEKFRPGIGGLTARRELGVQGDEILVGFVGTFGPWHGVLALARAIVSLGTESRIRFLMIGTGSLRDEFELILREGGVADRVIFTGSVEHERVPLLLDACDVLVSPHVPMADGSEFFGSPTKLFEYMAVGKAIVASRLGQIGDVLEHERTALLTEPGNVHELKAAVERLALDSELRERLGFAARAQAVSNHTWAHNADRVLATYREWVG
jgi:glycosyltransferase involved in cell wall biosynthesis